MAAAERNRSRASPNGQVGGDQKVERDFGPDLPRTRLNLVYKGTEMQTLLERLQRLGHHGTVTETIARALRVYEAFLEERDKGNQIMVQTKNGASVMRLI